MSNDAPFPSGCWRTARCNGWPVELHARNHLSLTGKTRAYRVQLSGADSVHAVRDVTFDTVEILGERLAAGSGRFQVREHVEDARFSSAVASSR